jgi:uncharacterized protein YbjT (DUF2867 family)
MKILVTGGTGTVGSHVTRELAARGADVSVLTRNPAKAKNIPSGVKRVEGDLLSARTVQHAFNGIDGVFLLNALGTTEAHEGLQAVCGMMLAGVKRIVYQSVQDADRLPHLPHFGSKVAIEHAVRGSGIPFTILRPSHFFQNDYMTKDAILSGFYAQPIGNVGTSRVDARDIAEAAAASLLSAEHEGQTYDLVGPEVLTGDRVAQIWSRALGRDVRYVGSDLDEWQRHMLQYLPDWLVFDLRLMFEHFQRHGLKGSPEAVARLTHVLGHPPRSFEAFAKEAAAEWQA